MAVDRRFLIHVYGHSFRLETNQNDIPDVAPFKPQFEAIRVQKQTPKPVVEEVYTFRPILAVTPSAAPLILGSPEQINPFGNPGPYVGNLYLPPTNDYLPPVDEAAPSGAISSGSGDFLDAPASDYYSAAAASSVFQYV